MHTQRIIKSNCAPSNWTVVVRICNLNTNDEKLHKQHFSRKNTKKKQRPLLLPLFVLIKKSASCVGSVKIRFTDFPLAWNAPTHTHINTRKYCIHRENNNSWIVLNFGCGGQLFAKKINKNVGILRNNPPNQIFVEFNCGNFNRVKIKSHFFMISNWRAAVMKALSNVNTSGFLTHWGEVDRDA